jgi:hypothetical protein
MVEAGEFGGPPNGYHPMPEGHRCRCPKLWTDGKGNHWCCRPIPTASPAPALPESGMEEALRLCDGVMAETRKVVKAVRATARRQGFSSDLRMEDLEGVMMAARHAQTLIASVLAHAPAPAPAPAPVDAAGLVAIDEAVSAYNAVGSGQTIHRLVVAVVSQWPTVRRVLAAAAEREAALVEKVRQSALDYLALDMQATEALEREKALVRRNAFLEQTKGCDMNDFVQMGMARDEAEARVTAAAEREAALVRERDALAREWDEDAASLQCAYFDEREARLAAEARVTAAGAAKDGAYAERNRCVSAIAKMALAAGYPVGIAQTAIEGWDEAWHGCVYIDLPTGQVSWHYHTDDAALFDFLPAYTGTWDGHSTPEKYERLAQFWPMRPSPAEARAAIRKETT